MPDPNVETITIVIDGDGKGGMEAIDKVIAKLNDLKSAGGGKTFSNLSTQIKNVRTAVNGIRGEDKLRSLANSMKKLKQNAIINFGQTPKRLGELGKAAGDLAEFNFDKLKELARIMQDFRGLPNINIPRMVGQSSYRANSGGSPEKREFPNVNVDEKTEEVQRAESAFARLRARLHDISSGMSEADKAFLKFPVSFVSSGIRKITNGFTNFLRIVKKRTLYRLINSMISAVTSGVKVGINAVYSYSQQINGLFAPAMDRLATAYNYLKASLGAALAPLITAVTPYIDSLIDKFVDLLNIVNQVFAYIGGQETWTKAIKGATTYADEMAGATKAAKELKKSVLGIDELNQLQDNSNASSGSNKDNSIGGITFTEVPVDTNYVSGLLEKLKLISGVVAVIGAGIAAWKFADAVAGLSSLKSLELAAGVTLTVGGLSILVTGLTDIFTKGKIDWKNALEVGGGSAAVIAGGALIGGAFGKGFEGAMAGVAAVGATTFTTALVDSIKNGVTWENGIATVLGATVTGAGIGTMISPGVGTAVGAAIGGIAGSLALVIADMTTNWEAYVNWFNTTWDTIKTTAQTVWGKIKLWGRDAATKIKAKWIAFKTWFSDKLITPIKTKFSAAWNSIKLWAANAVATIKIKWNTFKTWLSDKITTPIKTKFQNMWTAVKTAASTAWTKIKAIFKPAGDWFAKALYGVKKAFLVMWYNVKVFARGAWTTIKQIWVVAKTWIRDHVTTPIKTKFSNLWNSVKTAASTAWSKVKTTWTNASAWIKKYVSDPIKGKLVKIWTSTKNAAATAWSKVKTTWLNASTWIKKYVSDPVKTKLVKVWTSTKSAAATAWSKVKTTWLVAETWFKTNVTDKVGEKLSTVWSDCKTNAENAWEGVKTAFGTAATWFKTTFDTAWTNVKSVFSTAGTVFTEIKDGVKSVFTTVVNSLISGLNKVIAVPFNALNGAIKKLREFSITGIQPFKDLKDIPVPAIPLIPTNVETKANGGFVSADMFIARENGIPEMVGRIGNRTAVANNDQIVDGVAQGVYEANAEQNTLLREQNNLLRQILAKEGGGTPLTADAIMNTMNRWNRRVGATA